MKSAVYSVVLAALLAASSVNAHGQMTSPAPRPVSAQFLANSGALKNAGKDELQWAPLENLSQRKQADFPPAATFDIMNGCRGMVYESGNPVTEVASGGSLPVKWYVQAPHPGYAEFNIVKPKTGAGGKIMYEKVVTLKRLEDFAKSGGNFGDTVTIPASVTGCGKAGDCALQMYWHSDIANQTYPTCADIIIKGSGAGTGAAASSGTSGGSSSAATPAATSKTPAKTSKAPAATSKTPAKTSKAPASTGGDEEIGADASAAPAATPAPASTKKKCNRRFRA
ncbi:Highly acidic elicitin 20 [Globisporangium polare]